MLVQIKVYIATSQINQLFAYVIIQKYKIVRRLKNK